MNGFMTTLFIALSLIVSSGTVFARDATAPLKKVPSTALPFTGLEGNLDSFKTALKRQIARCKSEDLNERHAFGDRMVTRQVWCVDTNQKFLSIAETATSFGDLMTKARDQFEWYQSVGRDGQGEVLFTGYNSPTIQASTALSSDFTAPLYRRPMDLVQTVINGQKVWRRKNADGTFSMHYDRKSIDIDNALKGQGLELAYASDFFSVSNLQTEGSGVMMLHKPDGSVERRFVNYSASNGHPWVALTTILREQGVPEEYLTVPGIRKWFSLHPDQLMPSLAKNPSYVYFDYGVDGPYGSDSVLLSPHHSIAIDNRIFPQGAVSFFNTQRPEIRDSDPLSNTVGWIDFSTLAVTQDTGGAIVGPGHVDIYWGDDDYAEQASGRMHQLGKLFMAVAP